MTKKPKKRIQVLLPDNIFDIVEEISQLGGVSMGSLLGELVSENKPGLEIIRDALRSAKGADQTAALNRMQALLTDAQQMTVVAQKELNQQRLKHSK